MFLIPETNSHVQLAETLLTRTDTMCGILGLILANRPDPFDQSCAAELHEALYLLQHRGQDACGLATCAAGGKIYQCKGNGMATAVFKNGSRTSDLPGYMGIGHLRYPTAGTSANAEAQPIYVNSPYGIVMVHNGNLINAPELKEYLDQEAHRHINTDSDSELMLNIFADELGEFRKARVNNEDIVAALKNMYQRCKGAWACATMLAGYGIIGFRDSFGIRPLVLGERRVELTPGATSTDYMLASEDVALKQRGFKVVRDIRPGECVILAKGKAPAFYQVEVAKAYSPDIFEYVYFARPDSTIDGIDVYTARNKMGYALANRIKQTLTAAELADIDVVMPIPETSNTSATCVAEGLGKPYDMGFVKNRYVFRTFIMPGQKMRESSVRRKLNPMEAQFRDRNVLLIDDSIVRGTTSREIVTMAKGAGAKKVYFASCSPRITHAHIYGIDLASPSELIAHERDDDSIAKHLGAEKVIFQSLEDLKEACKSALPKHLQADGPTDFEVGVFCGKYCTPVSEGYFDHLEQLRGESKKMKVLDSARQAVANGIATDNQTKMVMNGAKVAGNEVLPASPSAPRSHVAPSYIMAQVGDGAGPETRMDIGLHNYGDYIHEPRG